MIIKLAFREDLQCSFLSSSVFTCEYSLSNFKVLASFLNVLTKSLSNHASNRRASFIRILDESSWFFLNLKLFLGNWRHKMRKEHFIHKPSIVQKQNLIVLLILGPFSHSHRQGERRENTGITCFTLFSLLSSQRLKIPKRVLPGVFFVPKKPFPPLLLILFTSSVKAERRLMRDNHVLLFTDPKQQRFVCKI